jgi:mono/diheme cytochrome c family protein
MWGRVMLGVLGALIVILAGGFTWLALRKPAMAPPSSIKVEATPARLARGRELFEKIAHCEDCHSQRDISKFAAPTIAGTIGGGFEFPAELGFPGKVTASNITPDPETGIGTWTDGEKIRAIREGVSRDGHALFPLMPYTYFRSMSDEDVYSVVAFLNTLPPIRKRIPRTELNFPVNLLIKGAPRPVDGPVPEPDHGNPLKYGEYLVRMAGCVVCHTPEDKGELIESKLFAGGREFRFGKFLVLSANITSDPETGIGAWSEAKFVNKFINYRPFAEGAPPAATQANFTLMPWMDLARLPEEDLKAIYAHLRTIPAKNNKVESHPEVVDP